MRASVALLLPLLFALGCVSELEHEPDASLVQALGVERAQAETVALLTSAVSPVHSQVHVGRTALSFWSRVGVGRAFMTKVRQSFSLPFERLARARVFKNGKVYLLDAQGENLWRARFRSPDDGARFVDLLFSLKAWTGPWPPPRLPEPGAEPPSRR